MIEFPFRVRVSLIFSFYPLPLRRCTRYTRYTARGVAPPPESLRTGVHTRSLIYRYAPAVNVSDPLDDTETESVHISTASPSAESLTSTRAGVGAGLLPT